MSLFKYSLTYSSLRVHILITELNVILKQLYLIQILGKEGKELPGVPARPQRGVPGKLSEDYGFRDYQNASIPGH